MGGRAVVQLGHGLVGQAGQDAAGRDEGVGGHDAGTAGVGDDGEAGALGDLVPADELGDVEDLADVEDAGHAGAPEGRVVDGVLPGQRARVRGGDRGRLGEPSGLVGDDGLCPGEGAGGRHELPGPVDGLDVEDDGLGLLVLAEVVDEIAEVDVEGVADGHEVGEADLLLQGPVEDRGAQGARLGNEGDVPFFGHGLGEARVELVAGRDDAQAVGPDDPHALGAAQGLPDLVLEGLALGPRLPESGRGDDDPEDARVAAFPDEAGDLAGRRADDGQVGRLRDILDVGDAGDPHDGLAHGADGVDDPAEAAADEIDEDLAADALGVGGDADEGDALGLEDLIERLNGHGFLLCLGNRPLSLIRRQN